MKNLSQRTDLLTSAHFTNGNIDFGIFQTSTPRSFSLRFKLENLNGNELGTVKYVEITGSVAIATKKLVRWRPAAAHASLQSSKSPSGIRLAVVQFESLTPSFYSYNPITTPFGYFGSTWLTRVGWAKRSGVTQTSAFGLLA